MLLKYFNRPMIDIHNFDIMRKEEFTALFDEAELQAQFVDYLGGFNFWLFGTRHKSKKILLNLLFKSQKFLDLLMNLLLRGRRPGSIRLPVTIATISFSQYTRTNYLAYIMILMTQIKICL